MDDSVGSDGQRPMIGSILRFVSDWVGADTRQPPPFRTNFDEDQDASDTVIEMKSLVEREEALDVDPERDRAIREWKQIGNVDAFLEQMYAYYQGKGFYGILLGRLCNLLILGFLVGFSLFLTYCIDWTFVQKPATAASHPTLSGVASLAGAIAFYGILAWQFVRLIQDVPNLIRMRRFYESLLQIPEELISTTDFSDVIDRVVKVQKDHPISVDRLNAYDVSNRIMRRENYLIALLNRDVIKTGIPLIGSSFILTKTLEWNLSFCILNYVFDENCSIRKGFLKDMRRDKLSQSLQKRFLLMGILNLVLSPFIFVCMLIYFIFRYGEEIYRNPKTIGMRQFTTSARWKLREFNELPHYFNQRLANSHRKATKYMDQFQSSRFDSLARLVSFVVGSFAVVLIGVTIANEDLLMHFEITAGKSIIWYVGLFGILLTICRSMMPDASKINDPEKLMTDIVEYTHHLPKSWRGKLHTDKVRREFGEMFNYKFSILFTELVSVIITPFILLISLPKCSDQLVDFFREFSVHVDGIGYVCSFALFDFRRHGNKKYGGVDTDNRQHTKQGKMEKSFLSFVTNNPNWAPPEDGTLYLSKMQNFEMTASKQASTFLRKPLNQRLVPREEDEIDDAGEEGQGKGIMSILNQYYSDHLTE